MKRFITGLTLTGGCLSLMAQGTIKVTVTGIQADKGGEISAGILDNQDKYPTVGAAMTRQVNMSWPFSRTLIKTRR